MQYAEGSPRLMLSNDFSIQSTTESVSVEYDKMWPCYCLLPTYSKFSKFLQIRKIREQ